jgi:O-antigen ligase
LVWALVLTGAALGALSGFQQVTGTQYTRYLGFGQVGDGAVVTENAEGEEVTQPRLAGPIGEKNYYAQYLLMLVPLGGYLVVSERRRLLRAAAAVATALTLVGISLTFSRGAAVGLMVVVLALAILGYIRPRQLAIVGVVIGLLLIVAPGYVARLTRIADVVTTAGQVDEAVAGRLGENAAAMLAFFDHPVVGVGPAQFRLYYEGYAREIGADQHTGTRRAHSLYLSTAAELGIVGVIAMLGVLGSTIRALWRSRRHWLATDPDQARLPTAFLLSLISFLTTAAFLDLAYARYFWLMLGVAAATAHIASRSTALAEVPSTRQA